jgi:hypothetical protein
VTVFDDPIPAPADLNPYGEQGRCYAKLETPIRPVVAAPVVAKRVPSKAEYVKLFALAGAMPKCVRERRSTVDRMVIGVARHFRNVDRTVPRSLLRTMRHLVWDGLVGVYDTGTIARLRHGFAEHLRRSGGPDLSFA